jgi:hypothetical protein
LRKRGLSQCLQSGLTEARLPEAPGLGRESTDAGAGSAFGDLFRYGYRTTIRRYLACGGESTALINTDKISIRRAGTPRKSHLQVLLQSGSLQFSVAWVAAGCIGAIDGSDDGDVVVVFVTQTGRPMTLGYTALRIQ